MNLKHQLKLLEQCGDPATMDRMMKVLVHIIMESDSLDGVTKAIKTLQDSTNTARARQTRENLLAFKGLGGIGQ